MPKPLTFLCYLLEKPFSHVYSMFIRNCLLIGQCIWDSKKPNFSYIKQNFCFRQRASNLFVILACVALIMLVLTGLSIEAGSQQKSTSCQTTLLWLLFPRYQLQRNTLCLKSLKTYPRFQEIASKQLFLSKNVKPLPCLLVLGLVPYDSLFLLPLS